MKTRNMVISLIGRPNVGKSSLFNALMKKQNRALTYDEPGVTRDRHYGMAKFTSPKGEEVKEAILVDTGGFYPQKIEENGDTLSERSANKFFNIMTEHARLAIEESDLILFVVDVREGFIPFDKAIEDYIRQQKKEFYLLVNKYDSDKQAGFEAEFYTLGVDSDDMMLVSAAHGRGVEEIRERLFNKIMDFEFKKSEGPGLQKGVTPREKVASRLAIIGAPNAGKSTLLNQFIGVNRALVSDIPGTTVDPIEGYFDLYFGKDAKYLEEDVQFSKNDHALFQQYDEFRRNNADVFQTISKSYNLEQEFHKEEGIYDNSDFDDEDFNEINERNREFDLKRSSYLEEQVFSESNDEEEKEVDKAESESKNKEGGSYWRSLHLVDTAGIRRRKSVASFIEEQSVYRSLRCISESDIVLFLIDATKGIGHQDRRLLDIALEKGKSIIICLNKMDLMKKELKNGKERKEWLEKLRFQIPWLNFCEIMTISAKEKKGLGKLKAAIKKTILVRRRSIPTGELNRNVFELVERHPIVVEKSGGKYFKVKYTSQIKSNPPTFLLFTNRSKGIPVNYQRYLKNGLRERFPFDNTPIHIMFRTGVDLEKRMKKMTGESANFE